MAVLDIQGRLFGRINLIDLMATLGVLALVPLGYASWTFVRAAPPVIETVAPAVIAAGQADQRIGVRGRHLRPFLRADVGGVEAVFVLESPERAQVQVPSLPPGAYDVAFFDAWKQIARFPKAVTVQPGALVDVRVRFVIQPEVLAQVRGAERERFTAGPAPFGTESPAAALVSYEAIAGRPLSVINALVRMRATWTADGWRANGLALRGGAAFILTGPTCVLKGQILSLGLANAAQ